LPETAGRLFISDGVPEWRAADILYMSKPANLSDEAYAALIAHKRGKGDSLSQIVLRFVPPPIRTFGDLEKHLENLDGPLIPDLSMVRRTRDRQRKTRHAD
jgi:hypothetical protein